MHYYTKRCTCDTQVTDALNKAHAAGYELHTAISGGAEIVWLIFRRTPGAPAQSPEAPPAPPSPPPSGGLPSPF